MSEILHSPERSLRGPMKSSGPTSAGLSSRQHRARAIATAIFGVLLLANTACSTEGSTLNWGEKDGGRRFVVINSDGPAPLRRSVGSTGSVERRIRAGRMVEVYDQQVDPEAAFPVFYYKVSDGRYQGWISQSHTTGEILVQDTPTSEMRRVRQPDGVSEWVKRLGR